MYIYLIIYFSMLTIDLSVFYYMTFTFILLFSNYGHLYAPVIYTVTVNISKSSEIIYSWKNQMISTANKIRCLK